MSAPKAVETEWVERSGTASERRVATGLHPSCSLPKRWVSPAADNGQHRTGQLPTLALASSGPCQVLAVTTEQRTPCRSEEGAATPSGLPQGVWRLDGGCRASLSPHLRMGTSILGPLPLITSNSMPSAGSGVRMSLNMITPSVWNARQGCSDSSMAISAVSDLSRNGMRSEYLQTENEQGSGCS